MDYNNFSSENDLVKVLETEPTITGQFLCDYLPQTLSDNSYEGKTFKNFILIKVSFESCFLKQCVFDTVIFRETDFSGTDFIDCYFKECTFSNIDSGFLMKNCRIEEFAMCSENEHRFKKRVSKLLPL